jgi:hypothetical protein
MSLELEKQIALQRKELLPDSYPISFGELANLYRDGDLNINPKFQRFFRWDLDTKSRFIESIFLGLPIPAIFIMTDDKGVWEVIDGLQRISTILSFMGLLEGEPLSLRAGKYLTALEGMTWASLSETLQRTFKREKIHTFLLKKESNANAKFDLFDRLNTGSASLSDQELRNCKLVATNETFYDWFESQCELPFVQTFFNFLDDEKKDEREDQEFLTRWMVLVYGSSEEINKFTSDKIPVRDFYDTVILQLASSFSDELEKIYTQNIFKTFSLLSELLEEDEHIMRKRNQRTKKLTGVVSSSRFNVFVVGLGRKIKEDPTFTLTKEGLREIITAYYAKEEDGTTLLVKENTSSYGRVEQALKVVKTLFNLGA